MEIHWIGHGGGMYVDHGLVVSVSKIKFSQNSAYSGGALYATKANFTSLGRAVFENNTANEGGALVVSFGHSMFKDCTRFAGNSAKDGGAVHLFQTTNTIFMKEVHVIGNTALAHYGGGFHIIGTSSLLFYGNVMFANNSAEESGGGIYVEDESSCNFSKQAVFSKNKARSSGGSIALRKESNLIFFSTVQIFESSAGWAGGGIAVISLSALEVKGESSIRYNSAYAYGGGVALDHSELRIEGRTVVADNSAQYGGGIHAIASTLTIINNVSLDRNIGHIGGGCSLADSSLFYCSKEHLKDTIIQFDSNFASQYGGAIWVEDIPFYSCILVVGAHSEQNPIRQCFYQTELYYIYDYSFSLVNNSALLAGSNLYGGSVDYCVLPERSKNVMEPSGKIFDKIFSLVNEFTDSSPISSDPMQVCLCTQYNEPDCSILNHTIWSDVFTHTGWNRTEKRNSSSSCSK